MTVGAAGVGFLSFDLKPPRFTTNIKSAVGGLVAPGYAVRPMGGNLVVRRYCGAAILTGDIESWHSYGTKFHQVEPPDGGNLGVVFVGAITGYVGLKGRPSLKLGIALRKAARKFSYELPSDTVPKVKLFGGKGGEGAIYSLYTVQLRNRPFDPDDVKNMDTLLGVLNGGSWWGRQYCQHFREAHKAVEGIGGKKRPRGVFTVTCGWRGWSLVSPMAKRSAKWKQISFSKDVKDKAEKVVKAFKRHLVFEKFWWGGGWIDAD